LNRGTTIREGLYRPVRRFVKQSMAFPTSIKKKTLIRPLALERKGEIKTNSMDLEI